jgi:vacuolar-type H+-ATPase subunit E/Vma4
MVLTTEEKLIHFQEDAMMNARAQSTRELDAYSENLNRLYEDHCKAAKDQAASQLRLAKEARHREHNRELSKKQLETRRRLTLTTDRIYEDLFARVGEMLEAYKKTPAYKAALLKDIAKAREAFLDQPLTIFIDKSDEHLLDALSQESGLSVRLAEESIVGGILALVTDKNILMDLSFASRLKEARTHLQLGGEGHV